MTHLQVDPIRCDGFGMCAELLPERIELDDWGYPILDKRRLTPQLLELAQAAVAACPRAALRLVDEGADRGGAPAQR